MKQVFISYASRDNERRAQDLGAALEAHGHKAWIAPDMVQGSENYAHEIPEAIAASDLVVVLVSRSALESPHVKREVDLALSSHRPLLPLLLDELTFDSLPSEWRYWLSTTQSVKAGEIPTTIRAVSAVLEETPDEVRREPARFSTLRQAMRAGADAEDLKRLASHHIEDQDFGLVDLDLHVLIEIEEGGSARLVYRHDVLNLTGEPRGGLPQREVWFENTARLTLHSLPHHGQPSVRLKMIHDAGHILKFVPRFGTELPPGGRMPVNYGVEGGVFVQDHYWAQSFPRYTASYHCELRTAYPLSWAELWRRDPRGDESEVTTGCVLTSDQNGAHVSARILAVQPNETVTLRWSQ